MLDQGLPHALGVACVRHFLYQSEGFAHMAQLHPACGVGLGQVLTSFHNHRRRHRRRPAKNTIATKMRYYPHHDGTTTINNKSRAANKGK